MKKIALVILLLSLFLYCGPKQQQVERYMEDSVEVVVNHVKPYAMKGGTINLSVEEEFTIDLKSRWTTRKGSILSWKTLNFRS
jgi:hypothetical protein